MQLDYDKKNLARIAARRGLRFVILHGSYAINRARPDSDVDIAVAGNHELSFSEVSRLHGELAEILGDNPERELDLKTLQAADPFFRYEVIKDGQLLYGDATAYEAFKASARLAYTDAGPLFDLERILMQKYQQHLNQLVTKYA